MVFKRKKSREELEAEAAERLAYDQQAEQSAIAYSEQELAQLQAEQERMAESDIEFSQKLITPSKHSSLSKVKVMRNGEVVTLEELVPEVFTSDLDSTNLREFEISLIKDYIFQISDLMSIKRLSSSNLDFSPTIYMLANEISAIVHTAKARGGWAVKMAKTKIATGTTQMAYQMGRMPEKKKDKKFGLF